MAQGVVGAHRQGAQLLTHAGLQAGIGTAGISAKLVYAAESLVGRLLVSVWGKATVTDRLEAIQPLQKRLMKSASAHIVDAHRTMRGQLLFDSEVVLVVVRRLQRTCRESIQAHSERASRCARGNPRA